MKIYLSHNYAAKGYLNTVIRPKLEAIGHTVNARWLDQPHEDRTPENQRKYAEEDCMDVITSDCLIYFADQHGDTPGRGKHIELGLALTKLIRIYIVGWDCDKSVFYFLKQVQRYQEFRDLYADLVEEKAKAVGA